MYKLVIGNKNYSSWSLRAWLYLRMSGIPFEEIRVAMFAPGWKEKVLSYGPAGRVPILLNDDLRVWDSLAICEFLRTRHKGAIGWPKDPGTAAVALSVTAEMHAGFQAVRNDLPQNIRARRPLEREGLSQDCRDQVARIETIWTDCLNRHGGPWLFGNFSIADVFYAPVALRFATYQIRLAEKACAFVAAVEALEPIAQWRRDASAEPERFDFIDNLLPLDQTPLKPG